MQEIRGFYKKNLLYFQILIKSQILLETNFLNFDIYKPSLGSCLHLLYSNQEILPPLKKKSTPVTLRFFNGLSLNSFNLSIL